MILIDGTLQIVPNSVSADAGTINVGNQSQQAVVLAFITDEGIVQVVLPAENGKGFVKAVEKATEDALGNQTSKLEIVGDLNEAEVLAQGAKKLVEG